MRRMPVMSSCKAETEPVIEKQLIGWRVIPDCVWREGEQGNI